MHGCANQQRTLDVSEHQRIVRLSVKEIIVADDATIIRHSIPAPSSSLAAGQPTSTRQGQPFSGGAYLLRWGVVAAPLVGVFHKQCEDAFVFADQRQQRMTILLLPSKRRCRHDQRTTVICEGSRSLFSRTRMNFHCPLDITFIRSAVHGGSYW